MAKEKGVFVINLTNEHRRKWAIAAQADVLVLKNICDPDFLPLIKKRKDGGKITIYEMTCDLGALETWNPLHFSYQDPENLSLALRLASYCDALQVPCTRLKDIYGGLNPLCRVFQNEISHVPPERAYTSKDGFVVGWGGDQNELQDMSEIAKPLSAWITSEPDRSLYLMGPEPILNLFRGIPEEKRRIFPPGSMENYFGFLRQIDVGIGPLKETPFNRSRSDRRFLEYAVSGAVPVVKMLDPYMDSLVHGETGFFYDDPHDMVESLTLLYRDPILVKTLGKSAREYVLRNRLAAARAPERIRFYRELLLKTSGAGNCHHLSHQVNGWAAMDGAVATGRHIHLGPTKFELLLHEGLAAMKAIEKREAAFRLFRRASAIEPHNSLPYLYGASVSPNPVETLQKAVELSPSSLKARIMLGDALAVCGNMWEALRWFKDAAEVFPEYELPHLKAASLLERVGRTDQANLLQDKASSLPFAEDRLSAHAPDRLCETGMHV
jgi:glycosyltransferase involved in cell wall biosynthesis